MADAILYQGTFISDPQGMDDFINAAIAANFIGYVTISTLDDGNGNTLMTALAVDNNTGSAYDAGHYIISTLAEDAIQRFNAIPVGALWPVIFSGWIKIGGSNQYMIYYLQPK